MSWLDDLKGKEIWLGTTIFPMRKILRFINGGGAAVVVADNDSYGSTDVTITAGGVSGVTVTTDQSPTVDDSGTSYNNVGAIGEVIINLPASPGVGTRFHALIADGHYMRFKANAGQTIQIDSLTSAVAGYVRCPQAGGKATIESVSNGRWMIHSFNGPWDVDS